MPEGHTLHRIARTHRRLFAGSEVAVWSPQGRFAEGASMLDGHTLIGVSAYGKHLFYRWDGAPHLHIHLGLVGKFPTYDLSTHGGSTPPATPGTRLVLANDRAVAHLAGPMSCRLIDPSEMDQIIAALGPDPLRTRRRNDVPDFIAALSRRRIPIGAALLDQAVLAGIGNVYRAELLFLAGIHPARPAADVGPDAAAQLWDLAVGELRVGVRMGRIVTVRPEDLGARRRSQLGDDERLYVYHRQGLPCRRCGTEIAMGDIGARSIWWCPRCQAA